MIDILFGIVSAPFDSGLVHMRHLTPKLPLVEAARHCYHAIFHIVNVRVAWCPQCGSPVYIWSCGAMLQDYHQNELYASAWINRVIDHACQSGDVDLGAGVLLTELLSNNERLLDEVITPETIDRVVGLVLSQVCFGRVHECGVLFCVIRCVYSTMHMDVLCTCAGKGSEVLGPSAFPVRLR